MSALAAQTSGWMCNGDEAAGAVAYMRRRFADRLQVGGLLTGPEKRAIITDLIIAGYPPATAAMAVGVHVATAYRVQENSRSAIANGKLPWVAMQAEAVARVAAGERQKDVAAALGVACSTVSRWWNGRQGRAEASTRRSGWHWKTRHIKADRVLRETALMLEGLVSTVALVDTSSLDMDEARAWAESMNQSLRSLNRFAKEITNGKPIPATPATPACDSGEDRPCLPSAVGADL